LQTFALRERRDRTHRLADMTEPYQGAITIVDQGCSFNATLVVTGKARGRVMYVDLECRPPFFPEDLDFLSWYERWLDVLLQGADPYWFGMKRET